LLLSDIPPAILFNDQRKIVMTTRGGVLMVLGEFLLSLDNVRTRVWLLSIEFDLMPICIMFFESYRSGRVVKL
jgi:hypothetical protein